MGLAAAMAVVLVVGCWAAAKFAHASAIRDPGAVVIDEVAGQWLALLPAPLDPLDYAVAFLLFRIFDIWKPWPVGWVDGRVHGGFGIMLDDLAAAVYAALMFLVLVTIGGATGVRS
jgi:phosphatidylglycerophosphatase A